MLGVVWDTDKLVEIIRSQFIDEIVYLRNLVTQKDQRIAEIEQMIFRQAGFVQDDVPVAGTLKPTAPRVRNWRDQKDLLEKKFRPPELVDREERWKKAVASAALEVEESAGEVRTAV